MVLISEEISDTETLLLVVVCSEVKTLEGVVSLLFVEISNEVFEVDICVAEPIDGNSFWLHPDISKTLTERNVPTKNFILDIHNPPSIIMI